jgi:hypothetical protein
MEAETIMRDRYVVYNKLVTLLTQLFGENQWSIQVFTPLSNSGFGEFGDGGL